MGRSFEETGTATREPYALQKLIYNCVYRFTAIKDYALWPLFFKLLVYFTKRVICISIYTVLQSAWHVKCILICLTYMEIMLIYIYVLLLLSRCPQLFRFVYNSVLIVFVILYEDQYALNTSSLKCSTSASSMSG